jgi:GH24 family phage-related lysozyme (muramidase)
MGIAGRLRKMKTNDAGLRLLAKNKRPALPLPDAEWVVAESVKVWLNPNQFAALVSFVSCRGEYAFLRSVLLQHVNSQEHFRAAREFARWNRQGGRVRTVLNKRREAERKLFLMPALVSMNGG